VWEASFGPPKLPDETVDQVILIRTIQHYWWKPIGWRAGVHRLRIGIRWSIDGWVIARVSVLGVSDIDRHFTSRRQQVPSAGTNRSASV